MNNKKEIARRYEIGIDGNGHEFLFIPIEHKRQILSQIRREHDIKHMFSDINIDKETLSATLNCTLSVDGNIVVENYPSMGFPSADVSYTAIDSARDKAIFGTLALYFGDKFTIDLSVDEFKELTLEKKTDKVEEPKKEDKTPEEPEEDKLSKVKEDATIKVKEDKTSKIKEDKLSKIKERFNENAQKFEQGEMNLFDDVDSLALDNKVEAQNNELVNPFIPAVDIEALDEEFKLSENKVLNKLKNIKDDTSDTNLELEESKDAFLNSITDNEDVKEEEVKETESDDSEDVSFDEEVLSNVSLTELEAISLVNEKIDAGASSPLTGKSMLEIVTSPNEGDNITALNSAKSLSDMFVKYINKDKEALDNIAPNILKQMKSAYIAFYMTGMLKDGDN